VIATLGFLGVIVAAVSSGALAIRGFAALTRPDTDTSRWLRIPVLGVVGGALVAMACLEAGLLADDFSIAYIANNSASTTPLLYKMAAAWASLQGSLVLWGLVLALFTLLVWVGHRRRGADPLGAGALGVMGVVALFVFVILATISNPFEVCTATYSGGFGCAQSAVLPWSRAVTPLEGFGPNPLLQNHPLMAVHPPVLYVGYVGLTVPFAFAMAALLRAESGDAWLRRTRSWTRIAWIFLTAGIVLGGLWSYEVLGWGGYWAWDPVENASFMPWLLATAFLHSAAVQLRRGVLQSWNFILVIGAFALTLLGTFLTRSGVILSVHSFTQSAIGPALLVFLMIVLVGSLGLFALRNHLVSSAPRLDSLLSREGAILLNNLLLALFAFVVMLGTLYPLIVEALTGDSVGVGRPFYDRVAVPLSYALLLVMAVGPFVPYRMARWGVVWRRIRNPLRVGLLAAVVTVVLGRRNGWILLSVFMAGFMVALGVRQLWALARAAAARSGDNLARGAWRVVRDDPAYWGGQVSHVGVALLALGIALSANSSVRGTATLAPGETVPFAGVDVTYVGPVTQPSPNRTVFGAVLELRQGDGPPGRLEPRLNQYTSSGQTVASPAVKTGLGGDFYVSLSSIGPDGISLDLYWFPFIWLVWLGGFTTALGGLLAAVIRRRRALAAAAAEIGAVSV
jgi:cytochrome c-type biogenesis protein CcmF